MTEINAHYHQFKTFPEFDGSQSFQRYHSFRRADITVASLYSLSSRVSSLHFIPPEHEAKQSHLRSLRNRQDLFHEEGMVALILDIIDKISVYNNRWAVRSYIEY